MSDCIFCRIVAKELPCYKIYEDENHIAFLDIFPRVKGHALLIPKVHYRWVYDVPEFGTYFETAQKVALQMQKALSADFMSFITMGEAVPHAHIHILPQSHEKIDGITFKPVVPMSKEEIGLLAQSISAHTG